MSTGAGAAYAAAKDNEEARQARAQKFGDATSKTMKSARKARDWMPDFAKEKGANALKGTAVDTYTGGTMPDEVETGELSMGGKIAGAVISGAALAAVAALIGSILPDSLDDDLIDWLEDDGMDDAADFVRARLQPGQQRG